MSHFVFFISTFLVLFSCSVGKSSPSVDEGTGDSGGGVGVRLKNENGRITLYDLHFTKNLLRVDFAQLKSRDEAIFFALERIERMNSSVLTRESVASEIQSIWENTVFMENGPEKKRDFRKLMLWGAEIVQIAYYDGKSQKLLVNRKLWDQLAEADKGALLVHEAIYKIFRERLKISFSDDVFILVGYLYASKFLDFRHPGLPNPGEFRKSPIVPEAALQCQTVDFAGNVIPYGRERSMFYVYEVENQKMAIDARVMGGIPCFGACVSFSSFDQDFIDFLQGKLHLYSNVEFESEGNLDFIFYFKGLSSSRQPMLDVFDGAGMWGGRTQINPVACKPTSAKTSFNH